MGWGWDGMAWHGMGWDGATSLRGAPEVVGQQSGSGSETRPTVFWNSSLAHFLPQAFCCSIAQVYSGCLIVGLLENIVEVVSHTVDFIFLTIVSDVEHTRNVEERFAETKGT